MLRFCFTDIDGGEVVLCDALSLSVNMEEDVPADDMTVVFPFREIPELSGVVMVDGEEVVFRGVVDEQQRISSPAGLYLRIAARSLAAHLLDNESVPVTYNHPSSRFIFERHAGAYGLTLAEDIDSTYFGELVVTKGMSEWQVLEDFASLCYASSPRVSADGVLRFRSPCEGEEVLFCDRGDGLRYTAVSESIRRCAEISRVNVKVTNSSGYTGHVDNPDALSRGIRRERYLNAMLTETPMQFADTMISAGRRSGYRVSVTVPYRALDTVGQPAAVHSAVLGELRGLYVSAARYTLLSTGESTELILRRRDS